MNWVTYTWTMIGGMSLALGLVQFIVWVQRRQSVEHLVYAIFALAAAGGSITELKMMMAGSTDEFARALRLCHFGFGTAMLCVPWFVRVRFRAGNRALLYAATALRLFVIGVAVVSAVTINIAHVQLHEVVLPGGVHVSAPVGSFSPWVIPAHLSLLCTFVYLLDTLRELRRRGNAEEYRRGWLICGSMLVFLLLGVGETAAVAYGLMTMPFLITPMFLLPILVLGYDLGSDVLGARTASDRLGASESRLRAAEDSWELAGQIAGIAPWSWDRVNDRLELSPKAHEMFGLYGDKLVMADWVSRIHPEDHERIVHHMANSLAHDSSFERNYRMIRPDGEMRWISSRGHIDRNAQGEVVSMRGVSFDLTEVRRVDAMFRGALEAAPIAFFLVDGEGRIALVNARACLMFGCTFAELEKSSLEALVPGWQPVAAREPSMRPRELLARRRDGVPLPVEVDMRPFEGGLRLVSVSDISERLRSEHASAQQRAELAHLSRVNVLGEMSASLAHELNQPLTAIVSNAQAAIRFLDAGPKLHEELRETLGDIAASGSRAGEVIRRLRAMLKKEEEQRQAVDVNQLIREVLQLFRSDLINRGVSVRTVLDERLPPVLGDRVQLQQVLLNLMINACDAMADMPGERRLCMCSRRLDADEVEFAVCDTGPGIEPARFDEVFEPFFTSKPNGTGLGLSVCKTIVKGHGGRIWASGNDDGGATFHVALATLAQPDATQLGAAELDRS